MSTRIVFTIMAIAIAWSFIYISGSGGLNFFYKWHSLEVGDSKEEVVAKLGKPYKESSEFDFWKMEPNEKEAKDAGSIIYLTWVKGIDNVFVVGFDEDRTVSYKVSGGS